MFAACASAWIAAEETNDKDYNVDIVSILSTSSLGLKIFRTNFLNVNIPILSKKNDSFIRDAYYGGATDYYLAKAKDLKYTRGLLSYA